MKIDKVSKMIVARLLVVAHRLISFSFFLSFFQYFKSESFYFNFIG